MRRRKTEKPKPSPVRPPIAATGIYRELQPWISRQLKSKNISRFNFVAATPRSLLARATAMKFFCHCGVEHYPVRFSTGNSTASLYVTGRRNDGHVGCKNQKAARLQVRWLQEDIGRVPKPYRPSPDEDVQPRLW